MERGGPRRHGHLDLYAKLGLASLGDVPDIAGQLQELFHQIDMTYYGTAQSARQKRANEVCLSRGLRGQMRKLTGN